nr:MULTISPECIES: hypothetical protein [Acetobacteraceae]
MLTMPAEHGFMSQPIFLFASDFHEFDGALGTGLYTETAGTALIGMRRIRDHSAMNMAFDLSDE